MVKETCKNFEHMAEQTSDLHVNHRTKTNECVKRTRVHDCDKDTGYLISSVSPPL